MFQRPFAETPAERAGHYRALAMTAEENAAATGLPALRAAYLRSADRWHKLAALMEMGTGYTPKKIAPRVRKAEARAAKPLLAACSVKQTASA
jgi:hypothetical protein